MEMSPDTLEVVGVNELFVAVTVDTSYTTEQGVVGHRSNVHTDHGEFSTNCRILVPLTDL